MRAADMRNRSLPGVYAGSTSLRPFAEICCWQGCETKIDGVDAPLCRRHLAKAYRIFRSTYLWMLHEPFSETEPMPSAPPVGEPTIGQRDGVVYFVRFRDLIKVGFTTNMLSRMGSIPHEEILGTAPGTMADEKRCHAAFKHLRVSGEWFRPEPELLAFIADVASPHPARA